MQNLFPHLSERSEGTTDNIWPKWEEETVGLEKIIAWEALQLVLFTKYYQGHQRVADEMDSYYNHHHYSCYYLFSSS
jgi:hypothetical protein